MSNAPITILTRLRAATRVQHERAERFVGVPESIESHIQILKNFYGFLVPWQAKALQSLGEMESVLRGRSKLNWLREDLKNLGILPDAIERIPQCNRLPTLNSAPAALGSMYVFEGASLGGQIVSREIEKTLGLRDGIGYSFYRTYGDQVGIMWREFGELLIRNTADTSADAVINAAGDTFQCLGDWFESC